MKNRFEPTHHLTDQELKQKRNELHREYMELKIEIFRQQNLLSDLTARLTYVARNEVPPQFRDAAARTESVNRSELAKLYGIDRSTLYRRLQPIAMLLPTDRQRFTLAELALIYMELGIPSGLDVREEG